MDLGIEGRVALVLGASSGLGRAIATALGREGARVALTSRSAERLAPVAEEIGGDAAVFEADTNDLERMAALVPEVEERLGPVEILVLNTGGPPLGMAMDNSTEEWQAAFRSLVLAPRALIEAALPGMKERGWGRIANVASSSIREPILGLTLSNANRMAALGLAQHARPRGRRRRDHGQHDRHRSLRHPAPREQLRLARRRRARGG